MIDNETTIAAAVAPTTATDFDRLHIRVGARIDEVERYLIEATLNYFQGNKRRAAGVLGCSVKTLYNKLNEYSRKDKPAKAFGTQLTSSIASDNQLPA